uniref:Thioredoxin domain-containing protein n=1 Tax=Attheya septentrionalis TaxID=420275 RepID=A0A7S2UE67_9STRA|mmetsp:Transcript_20180/g.36642  ORF Transcript_20180/g.36642 Transcript_20180/m.36642 type:complete len:136 (+) Transcript_20180:112-519(+)
MASVARIAMRQMSRSSTSKLASSSLTRRTMASVTLSDEDAVEKFRSLNSKSVLYFTATWCPPCKAIAPIYEKLSEDYSDVAFGKVDVDANSDSALDFEVRSVPTFVLFDGETAVHKFSGADANQLEEEIKKLIAK